MRLWQDFSVAGAIATPALKQHVQIHAKNSDPETDVMQQGQSSVITPLGTSGWCTAAGMFEGGTTVLTVTVVSVLGML